jgi:hypothetical protein
MQPFALILAAAAGLVMTAMAAQALDLEREAIESGDSVGRVYFGDDDADVEGPQITNILKADAFRAGFKNSEEISLFVQIARDEVIKTMRLLRQTDTGERRVANRLPPR